MKMDQKNHWSLIAVQNNSPQESPVHLLQTFLEASSQLMTWKVWIYGQTQLRSNAKIPATYTKQAPFPHPPPLLFSLVIIM